MWWTKKEGPYNGHWAKGPGVITKTFTVSASPWVMKRFERLLTMMHFASSWGHTNYFGMPMDGDGSDRFGIKDLHREWAKDVEKNMRGDLELALDDSFGNRRVVRLEETKY